MLQIWQFFRWSHGFPIHVRRARLNLAWRWKKKKRFEETSYIEKSKNICIFDWRGRDLSIRVRRARLIFVRRLYLNVSLSLSLSQQQKPWEEKQPWVEKNLASMRVKNIWPLYKKKKKNVAEEKTIFKQTRMTNLKKPSEEKKKTLEKKLKEKTFWKTNSKKQKTSRKNLWKKNF